MSINTTNMPAAATMSKTDLADVWRQYWVTRSDPLRNLLVEHYLHLVDYHASRIHLKLPKDVERDDLLSAGIFGLMDAIKAFDAARGVKFETYAAPRIRGAILDELRNMDWVPRLARTRSHKLSAAARELEIGLGRSPTHDEICAHLKASSEEFDRISRDAELPGVVSLSRRWFETNCGKEVRETEMISDKRSPNPSQHLLREDLKEFVLQSLNREERLLVTLMYYEGLNGREIGAAIGVSESCVSVMHSRIMKNLRSRVRLRRAMQVAPPADAPCA